MSSYIGEVRKRLRYIPYLFKQNGIYVYIVALLQLYAKFTFAGGNTIKYSFNILVTFQLLRTVWFCFLWLLSQPEQ